MKKSVTVKHEQTQKSKDSGSDPMSTPYKLGIRGQPLHISGAAFLHLPTRKMSLSIMSMCLDFLKDSCIFKHFFLFSHPPLDYLGKPSCSVLKLHFTGCLEFKEALRSFDWFCFQNFGEDLWSLYSRYSLPVTLSFMGFYFWRSEGLAPVYI